MISTKYKTTFSSKIKTLGSAERDTYLAKASLESLKSFIPEGSTKNISFLPFACSACVVNHVNLNGAVVDKEEGIKTAELFIWTPVNLEHDRFSIRGVILSYGFSEFGSEKPLTKEEASKIDGPFNVTVGGIIWKVVDDELIDFLEETNDPTSEHYMEVSASFEMGFDDYNIVVLPENSRNLADGNVISDKEQIANLSSKLKTFGGSGKLEDGKSVAILLKGNVVPLGIGLTTSPAAAVKGIAVNPTNTEKLENSDAIINNNQKNEEKISHLENLDVKKNNEIMKINSLKDITDDSLKTITASSIVEFVDSEFKKFSEDWAKEKAEKEGAIKVAEEKYKDLQANHEKIAGELEKLKETLTKLEEEKATREKTEKFNSRMASFDDKYELSNEDRRVLASQIKNIDSDEEFVTFQKDMEILLNNKNKETIAKTQKTGVKEIVASETKTKTESTEVVESALENASPKPAPVAATTTVAPISLKDKYKSVFAEDQFEIQTRNRRRI